jgi:hypothetical protein
MLATLAVVLATLALAACGSGSAEPGGSAAPIKTTITAVLPKDASAEPPWNGRFVQVDVTTAKPDALRAEDWRVFVNGKQPELDKPASILPYAPHAATVAFIFRAPYGDLGTYEFRVVYAPEDGAEVERSWQYQW